MNVLHLFDLSGKVALVTGGAGLYGQQIVRALAEAGAHTWVASRNAENIEALAAKHRDEGHDVRSVILDQGDEASILAARTRVIEESGQLDVLVNNAVARPASKGLFDDVEAFDASMHVNGTGLIVATRALGEVLSDGGSIINIGSMMGMVGVEPLNYEGTDMLGWYPDYFFHKGGMVNLTRFFASYYGPRSIRVNCVNPGGLENESHPQQFIENYSRRTCLGRLANDTDLMGTIVFLAGDASRYVTGTNIPVDGGYTAK